MKVLEVIPTLGQGGAEHFVAELSIELKRMGIECDVVTLFDVEKTNDLLVQIQNEDIKTYSLHKKDGFDLSVFYSLVKLIKKGHYNVVHAHVGAIKYVLLAAFVLPGVKFFATLHSEASREAGKSLDLWSRKLMFKTRRCTPVTISEESQKSFEDFYGYKAEMVLNGVSDYVQNTEISIRDNKDQIVFVHPASCQPVKNQFLLLKAFALLIDKYPNSKLIWIGSLNSYPKLYEDLKKIMVPQVVYMGVVSNVRDYLSQADAMCLSSQMEGLPMTVIESFSVGCIPICTPVGGCKNIIIDKKNGLLSKDLSVNSYYNALEYYCKLSDADKRNMRNSSKESFSNYTISKCASQYLELFND